MTRVFFRADGSSSIGLGHVYRSCALADMLRGHFECHFVIRNATPALHSLINAYCRTVINLETEQFSEESEATHLATIIRPEDIVVLDGYHFKTDYQRIIKESVGCKLVSIDDIQNCHYLSDAVISHIGGLTPAHYQSEFYTEFYLGLRYALIRKEFTEPFEPQAGRDSRLLIFLGGADPANDISGLLHSLDLSGFAAVHIITGAGYRYKEQLDAEIAAGFPNTTHHHRIEADAVRALMLECGYAVLAPSTVSYEYMSLGGIVFLKQIADNQTAVKAYYLKEGLARDVAEFGRLPEEAAQQMLVAQKKYFDGASATRLLRIFQSLEFARDITVRHATEADAEIVFQWANDPGTRAMSYNSEPIAWENHIVWFTKKVATAPHYYLLEHQGAPFAQIRFDTDTDGTYVLGFLLDPAYRNRGLGAKVLAEGMTQLKADIGQPATVAGYVKYSNPASRSSFERLAFVREETTVYPDSYKYTISI